MKFRIGDKVRTVPGLSCAMEGEIVTVWDDGYGVRVKRAFYEPAPRLEASLYYAESELELLAGSPFEQEVYAYLERELG